MCFAVLVVLDTLPVAYWRGGNALSPHRLMEGAGGGARTGIEGGR